MRERTQLLGGGLRIEMASDASTTVRARLPMTAAVARDGTPSRDRR